MYNLTPEEKEQLLLTAKNQYIMAVNALEETRKELKRQLNPDKTRKYKSDEDIEKVDSIKLLKNSVEQAMEQYVGIGGDENELKEVKKEKKKNKSIDIMSIAKEVAEERNIEKQQDNTDILNITEKKVEEMYIPTDYSYTDNPTASFDVIPLPSNGECYKGKNPTIAVEYLTARDENIIINPNLYSGNKVLDYILKEKIRDKSINPDELLEGDRDAIILFLRSSGYGNEYPIIATDDETGEKFETIIDLSKLKYKPFTLKSDENGWFDFLLPSSKANIKFRFLTHKDNVILEKIDEKESKKLKKNKLAVLSEDLNFLVENDETLNTETKVKMRQSVRNIEDWKDSIDDSENFTFTHKISNELEYSIMEIEGNQDRKFIHEFVQRMPIKDSTELRKYINKNMPGVDYEIEIERPASLGGGSIKFFPKFNQFIFLTRTV